MKPKYYYGYNIVAASFIIQSVCVGTLVTFGIFFKEFQSEFGWSRAAISGATSLNYLLSGVFGIIFGRLNDRIGPKFLIMISGLSLGIGYILMSRMNALWHLYLAFGIFIGIGVSTVDVVTLSTIARWFVKRRGAISGVVKVGTGSGQFLIPLIAAFLIIKFGWRNAYVIIAAALFILLLLTAQVLRRDPQSMGLLPDNESNSTSGSKGKYSAKGLTLKEAALTRQLWIMCMAWFTVFFCLLTIPVHIVPHASDIGISPGTAAGVMSAIGGVSILGRIVMGATNDRLGGKRSLIICFIVLLCSLTWIQFAGNTWMLFLFAAIYGFAHGGFFTVISPTVAELFGIASHGTIFGIILFCGTIGGSIGPIMAGAIFDRTGSYQIAFLVLAGVAILGMAMIGFLKPVTNVKD